MKAKYERQVDRAGRIEGYGINHPLTPPNARAAALFGQVTVLKLEMRNLGSNQVHGFVLFRGGASERATLARNLEQMLRGIWETARTLDPVQYPNAAEQFRVPAKPRHQQLIDHGHAFLGAIGPIKAAFVEHAWPTDFDEQLADKIAQLNSAIERREMGRQERRRGTAGLDLAVKKLTAIVAELNAIMKTALRTSEPALLEVWKNAVRVYSDPVKARETAPSQTVAPAASLVTLASVNNRTDRDENALRGVEPRMNGTSPGVLSADAMAQRSGACARLRNSGDTNNRIMNDRCDAADRHLPHGTAVARAIVSG